MVTCIFVFGFQLLAMSAGHENVSIYCGVRRKTIVDTPRLLPTEEIYNYSIYIPAAAEVILGQGSYC